MGEGKPQTESCDVAVIGGGPAGLAAATRLRELGVPRVVLIEREEDAGGVPRHCGHSPYGLREFRRPLSGPAYARALVASAAAAGVEIWTRHSVADCGPGPSPVLTVSSPDGLRSLTASRVILATGIRETPRSARLIGGTRPQGVMTTGALQSLVYLKGMAPFKRPVILGTELVAFSSILTCRHAGMRPSAMVEPNSRVTAWRFARALPLILGVPLHLDTSILAVHGKDKVRGVTLRDATGKERPLDCDGLIVTGGFTPETALVRRAGWAVDPGSAGPVVDQFGRLDDESYFAAGNLLRPVETAGWCWQEGRSTGDAVHRDLNGGLPPKAQALPVRLEGDALRYAVAQRLCRSGSGVSLLPSTLDRIQLRASRAVRGLLVASADGREIWSKRVNTLPERRLSIPFSSLAGKVQTANELTLAIREDS